MRTVLVSELAGAGGAGRLPRVSAPFLPAPHGPGGPTRPGSLETTLGLAGHTKHGGAVVDGDSVFAAARQVRGWRAGLGATQGVGRAC